MVEKHSKQGTAEEKLNMQDVLSMRSSGYYSQRTAGAKNAIDSVLPLMKEAVNNLPETEEASTSKSILISEAVCLIACSSVIIMFSSLIKTLFEVLNTNGIQ